MFPLNPVQITAEEIKLRMDRTDSINLVKNLLSFLDDVLGLLQLIVLVQLDLADQHSAQDESLIVHLCLLLNLLDEGNGLFWISEPLHHGLGDLNQGQGVKSGLEINDELLINSDQLILKTSLTRSCRTIFLINNLSVSRKIKYFIDEKKSYYSTKAKNLVSSESGLY